MLMFVLPYQSHVISLTLINICFPCENLSFLVVVLTKPAAALRKVLVY